MLPFVCSRSLVGWVLDANTLQFVLPQISGLVQKQAYHYMVCKCQACQSYPRVPLCEDRVEERKTTKTKTKHKKQKTNNPQSQFPVPPKNLIVKYTPFPPNCQSYPPPLPPPQCQIVPPSPTQYSCLFLGVHICAYLLKRGTHSVLAQTASWQGVTLVYLSYPWWL